MKGLITYAAIILFSTAAASQTQGEMNQDAYQKYGKANDKLFKLYQQILFEYRSDTLFISNFQKAQNIWTQFRDAQLAMKYPESGNYGSVLPMCKALYLADLTNDRIKTLRIWVNGIEEGDVCIGSVRFKPDK